MTSNKAIEPLNMKNRLSFKNVTLALVIIIKRDFIYLKKK